jgi:hypothetical protein
MLAAERRRENLADESFRRAAEKRAISEKREETADPEADRAGLKEPRQRLMHGLGFTIALWIVARP